MLTILVVTSCKSLAKGWVGVQCGPNSVLPLYKPVLCLVKAELKGGAEIEIVTDIKHALPSM